MGGSVGSGGSVGPVAPLQATPFSLKVAGTALFPLPVALKPKEAEAPEASVPL